MRQNEFDERRLAGSGFSSDPQDTGVSILVDPGNIRIVV
jgi:hypothetical protein